jgi:putative SOS response-associated peptidase YedK
MVRSESLSRGAFASSFRRRRCILVADGFYEWQREGKTRIAHYIHKIDESPLAMAGIWDLDSSGEAGTCAVITRSAVAPLIDLHDRMPATVARADYDRWLDPRVQEPAELARMLDTDIGLELGVLRVGTHVNSPRNDDPLCIEPDRGATGTG